MLKERNVRKGFFEHSDFLTVRDVLPEHLKGVATFGYRTGWRFSEIATLTWSRVDIKQGIVRLEVGETKNDDARTVYLDDELKHVIDGQWNRRIRIGTTLPYVFLNRDGNDRVKRFDKSWKTACKKAGVGIKVFHDFRRTAVCSRVRSRIPERVGVMTSEHKTGVVFERHNLLKDTELRPAHRQHEYLVAQMLQDQFQAASFRIIDHCAPVAQEDRARDS
jgi:integrase